MITLSMTLSDLWPDFKVTTFSTLNISETTRNRAIVTIEHQSKVVCALSKCGISNDLDGPLTRFSRSQHFGSRISQKRCVLGTKLLKNANRKPYMICRLIPLSMTLSELWPRFQGPDIFRHEIPVKWPGHFRWPWVTFDPISRSQHFLIVTIERQ